jgi:glucose/arabinose dehydrogenase
MAGSTRRRVAAYGLMVVMAALLVRCGGDEGAAPSPVPSGTPAPPTASCSAGEPVSGVPALEARLIAEGFSNPLDLQAALEDRERVYVVEQGGRIRTIVSGEVRPAPFLDIADRIRAGGEQGLLGLAFHPEFASNRRLFVNYSNRSGATHIAEFRATSADRADPETERVLLVVPQPFSNHNGGSVAFGPDGFLYVALGDGGSGGDPLGAGQDLGTLLGKILRIDVDSGAPYAVPADNPLLSTPGAEPEIWAYGLRNPYRMSFDRATGDLYIGDVGQSRREEIDVGLATGGGGENYGWNVMEGRLCFAPSTGCDTDGLTRPVLEYGHDQGCSVTGGVVYSGCRMPDLAGTYFYGDFCTGFVRSFRLVSGAVTDQRDWTNGLEGIGRISSFGTDAEGEVYVVDFGGRVYRLEPAI